MFTSNRKLDKPMSKCPQILATYETGDDKGSLLVKCRWTIIGLLLPSEPAISLFLADLSFTVMTFMLKEAIYPVHDSNNQ